MAFSYFSDAYKNSLCAFVLANAGLFRKVELYGTFFKALEGTPHMTKTNIKPSQSTTKSGVDAFISKSEKGERLYFSAPQGLMLIKNKGKSATWAYRYTDFNGKRVNAYRFARYPAINRQEAIDIVTKWQLENVDPQAEADEKRQLLLNDRKQAEQRTLGYYLEHDYLPHLKRENAANGGKQTAAIVRRNFGHLLDKDMALFIKADIHEWQQAKLDEGMKPNSIKRIYAALRGLFKHAANDDDGILDENPLELVKLKTMPRQNNDETVEARRAFTQEEVEQIHLGLELLAEEKRQQRANSRAHGKAQLTNLSKAPYPHWFVPFTYVAWHTGLRTGDIFSLTWQELNIKFKRLNKTPSKTSFGNNQKPITINIPLSDELLTVITEWHKQQGKPKAGLVFPSERTGGERDRWSHRKPWKKVKALGGLPDELTFYSFRHNFISQLISNNVPLCKKMNSILEVLLNKRSPSHDLAIYHA